MATSDAFERHGEQFVQWLDEAVDLGGKRLADFKTVFTPDREHLSLDFCIWVIGARDSQGVEYWAAETADDLMSFIEKQHAAGTEPIFQFSDHLRASMHFHGMNDVMQALESFDGLTDSAARQPEQYRDGLAKTWFSDLEHSLPLAYQALEEHGQVAVDGFHQNFTSLLTSYAKVPEEYSDEGQRIINKVTGIINAVSMKEEPIPMPFAVPEAPALKKLAGPGPDIARGQK